MAAGGAGDPNDQLPASALSITFHLHTLTRALLLTRGKEARTVLFIESDALGI